MPVVQLPFARPHDVLGVRQPERHEQQAGLVDVPVVLVDDGDDGLVGRVQAPQPVGGQRAAGAAAEDHDPRSHMTNIARSRPVPLGPNVPARPGLRPCPAGAQGRIS